MSVQVLMKNIYNYLGVLQSARTDGAAKWDTQSLNHALQWANYCQEVILIV